MADFSVENTDNKYQVASWVGLTGTENGKTLSQSKFSDKTVQITGALDGGTVTLKGSMDGSTWFTLTTDGVNEINTTGLFWVWENPRDIRPELDSGGASSDIDVHLGMASLV